ncbi:hypothetical protein D3C76_1090710 [compost metagenome]
MNWPMKNVLTASMPSATGARVINLKTLVLPCFACEGMEGMEGRRNSSQTRAMAATGTMQKNAPRQPMIDPRKLPSGAATTVAKALPPLTMASACGT